MLGQLQIGDTKQRGRAATKGAWVCDPRELCRPPSFLKIQRVGRSQRAPAHRAALRKIVAARDDLDGY